MITPRHKYDIPTVIVEHVKNDQYIPTLVHCLLPQEVPIGHRKLFSLEYKLQPINLTHADTSNLLLELATISNDQQIGERIVSRILFKAMHVVMVIGRMASIEVAGRVGVRPLLTIKVMSVDIQHGMPELDRLLRGRDAWTYDHANQKSILDPTVVHHPNRR